MSLNPKHIYVYDRFNKIDEEEDEGLPFDNAETGRPNMSTIIDLKDDGLGKYNIAPLDDKKEEKHTVCLGDARKRS